MKKVQRLLGLDSEAPAEGRAVRRERVIDLDLRHSPQPFPQVVEIRPELSKMLGDGQRDIRNDEETRGLRLRLLQPEYLGQRDVLSKARIPKAAENDGVGIMIAQGDRTCGVAGLAAFRFVMPQHVGLEIAFARFGARRLVVGHLLRGYQERRDGIDQRRLPGSYVAGEQRIAA